MNQGFFRCAAMTPVIKVADCIYNTDKICELIDEAAAKHTALCVFSELCITGYTCNDLFYQETLQQGAIDGLMAI
ncbi:MAG: nitrilase-related carbon-nitrogen hydrolase, partial [Lachnospiraceae bacterium]